MLGVLQRVTRSRELSRYPSTPARWGYFVVVTLASAAVFYQLYVQGAVSPLIIADFGIPLRTFVLVSIVGNAVGAVAAWAAGLADRIGRVNLVLVGMAVACVVVALLLPACTAAGPYIAAYALLSLVGGVVLVATSALMRDFSPQVGRATAMGLWAIGPALGSLLISSITSHQLPDHPDWQFHLRIAGLVGAAALVLVALTLRDLSPAIRNQVMVSLAERHRIEARAKTSTSAADGAERESAGRRSVSGLGSMWRPVVVLPAIGISVFLMFYVTRVGFFVLYFVANFGYSPSKANGLATWYWVANIVGFLAAGYLSDRVGVRKPFLVGGALVSVVTLAVFASKATQASTSYSTFVLLLVLLAAAGATVSTSWLALFTETVESIDASAVARGMAVYGAVLRGFAVLTLVLFMTFVTAAGVLVDQGPKTAALAAKYQTELGTLAVVQPDLITKLRANPDAPRALKQATSQARKAGVRHPRKAVIAAATVPVADLQFLADHGPKVEQAAHDGPLQWRRWWWICLVGQLLLIPLAWRLDGPWLPTARRPKRPSDRTSHNAEE